MEFELNKWYYTNTLDNWYPENYDRALLVKFAESKTENHFLASESYSILGNHKIYKRKVSFYHKDILTLVDESQLPQELRTLNYTIY